MFQVIGTLIGIWICVIIGKAISKSNKKKRDKKREERKMAIRERKQKEYIENLLTQEQNSVQEDKRQQNIFEIRREKMRKERKKIAQEPSKVNETTETRTYNEKPISDDQVLEAVTNGNLILLQNAVSHGFDINKEFEFRYTVDCRKINEKGETIKSYQKEEFEWFDIFSIACKNNQYAIINYLLDKGIVFNNRTNRKYPYAGKYKNPIVESVILGNTDLLKFAFSHGFDINTFFYQQGETEWDDETGNEYHYDPYFYSLLSIACEVGNKAIVEFLVKNGAIVYSETEHSFDEHCNDEELKNPIIISCEQNKLDILKFLIDNGGSFDVSRSWKYREKTLVDIAVHNNNMDILNYLISKGKSSAKKLITLHAACQKGDVEIVKYLIKNGANINQKQYDNQGQTPIETAGNNVEIIQLLLSKGAMPTLFGIEYDININSGEKPTAQEILSAIELLINNGADVNEEKVIFGTNTPLVIAVFNCNYFAVKYLIENGADYNYCIETEGDITGGGTYQSILSFAKTRLSDNEDNYKMTQLKQIIDYLISLGVKDYEVDAWAYDNFVERGKEVSMSNPFATPIDTSIEAFIRKYDKRK